MDSGCRQCMVWTPHWFCLSRHASCELNLIGYTPSVIVVIEVNLLHK